MTFIAYWFRLCRANRELNSEDTQMRISVESLKKQLRKAYDQGRADEKLAARESDPFAELFRGLGR